MNWQWLADHAEYGISLALLAGFLSLLLRQHFINKAPEYIASATVLSRRMGTARYHGKYSSGYNHLVTFQLGENDTLELYISREEYSALTEGLRGTLRWQNDNLLSFDPSQG